MCTTIAVRHQIKLKEQHVWDTGSPSNPDQKLCRQSKHGIFYLNRLHNPWNCVDFENKNLASCQEKMKADWN